jgi:glycoside/pentoside/hexuronide:cation symporter, GPH family
MLMKSENYLIPESERVSTGCKIGYAIGDFGANFQYQSVAIFLMYYFTDVFGISATAAGSIFLLSKFWDAITDPTMGYIADHTNTRWGQKRPWLLIGSIPLGITMFLLYAVPPIQSYGLKVAYATFTFLAVLTFYTIVNVPYAAMSANLTMDSRERNNLTGFRMMGAILGTLVVATITKPFVGAFTNEVTGFRILGLVYGIAICGCTLVTFFSVKERVRTHSEKIPGGASEIIKVIKSNPPLVYLMLGTFFMFASYFTFLGVVAYFFKYCIKNEGFIGTSLFVLFLTAAIMLPFYVKFANKFGKRLMYVGGMTIFTLGVFATFFVHNYNFLLFVVIYIFIGMGTASIYQGPWATIPDTIEYSEWKTGLRREGIIYGIFFFGMKLSTGFAAFFIGTSLDWGGYVADAVQTPQSLWTIRFVTTIVPMILFAFGAFFLWLYPINHKVHKQMVTDIMKRSEEKKQTANA